MGNNNDLALPADRAIIPTGSSPSVSPVPVSVPSAKAFVSNALMVRIGEMLAELDHPPLVDQLFPKGWQSGTYEDLMGLYELCRRTFAKRGNGNG